MCLPGLSRNARDFHDFATTISTGSDWPSRRVFAIDSRGRGKSGWAPFETYNILQELDDLLVAMRAWGLPSAQFVGTSRGGLLIMLLAMREPDRIERAVLNDIGPTIERKGLARIAGSAGLKMKFASFEELAKHLAEGLSPQFPRMAQDKWVKLAKQLASPVEGGGVRLDYDPALADTVRDYSVDDPAPDFWPGFEALADKLVLVVRGAYSDLLSAATVEAMRRRHPGIATHVVPDEGHAPLLWDRPSIEMIRSFLL